MKKLESAGHSIYFETELAPLMKVIEAEKYSKIFVFADTHTSELCLPLFREMMDDFNGFDLIETDPGEENKNIDFCIGIWKTLLDFGADRKCLMVNLGGGVITDMGGFVASTYKRGIDFINIPTTLLSQVDASVGGKTGIDVDNVKNMVGTFTLPQSVFIETKFLKTLPQRELLSGFAEMIKHGLIVDRTYYNDLKSSNYLQISAQAIYRSVEIKNEVVTEDPHEKGLRKILNYGHTIGHAVETYSLINDTQPLTHGEAIAVGMICEAFLSSNNNTLSADDLKDITDYISTLYPAYRIKEDSFKQLLEFMQSDKKNENGQIMFSLLSTIGKCDYNCRVSEKDILESFAYFNRIYS
ncbi:3-dehydroquinate synthase [Pedobacter heparinus]|uniref:3-dehydroquinate synthase n=1 Tax=Pedobacter heparinus (strain ATCC 13125 / DSM 2366 / CIP 104194 / JCM 7457 / NBRC 12017 / NCIMB 9290 / NRRL B-14731 / HIM 762-3) TaxID=485917 RepID=C6XTU2_PEDHD|nr:3-dehydroquinate synthase [Pedobacter heparinus]ACU03728.1 3-dehydroquinate synthase [Pedobacter heparinus DSM 2366]